MMTIGRFAEATGLTVKALRHYDEIGLLAPAHVDPESGHRYYEAAQVEDAVAIRRLRALELPLEEIHSLLRADADGFRSGLAAHGYHVGDGIQAMCSRVLEHLQELGVEPAGEPTALFRGGDRKDWHLVEAGWPRRRRGRGAGLRREPGRSLRLPRPARRAPPGRTTVHRDRAGQGHRISQPIRIVFPGDDHARLVWLVAP